VFRHRNSLPESQARDAPPANAVTIL